MASGADEPRSAQNGIYEVKEDITACIGDVIAHHGVLDERIPFIQKPFSNQVLAAKVRQVLDS